jgi:hypothetical protein
LEGELTVFFTSYPKIPSVDAVLGENHLRDLVSMMQATPRESQRCSFALATIAEQFVSCQQLAAMLQQLEDSSSRFEN